MLLFKRYNYDPKKDLIGKGGFSRVYRAWDTVGEKPVALKVYKANELTDRYSPIAEIKRVIDFDHPNICKYLGIEEIEEEDSFGQVEKIQVCVMELLEGGSFAGYYNLNKDITVFKKLLIDVLNGISYLHKNDIIHRDIKPANILISQNAEGRPIAKITDFGLSKRADALENSSSSGLLISVPYMAPEQLNPEKYGIDEKVHPNIDLWSIGVTVYEILSNDILFKNHPYDSPEQVMANIISQDIPQKIKKLPEPFSNFVSMCLVKDAKLRVKTADELIEILGPIATAEKKETAIEENTVQEPPALTVIAEDDTRLISQDDTMVLPSIHNNDDRGDETTLMPQKKPAEAAAKKIKDDKEDIVPAIPARNTSAAAQSKTDKENTGITLFNRYTYNPLSDLIGRGGFSRVYRASDKKLGRLVALKIYKTSEFSDRYSPIAEIRRVVNLDHPNICRYLDIEEIEKLNPFGETEKVQVCVMELLDSGNFSEYFTQSGKNIDTFKKLLQDVLHGIAYLHKNGIIHRDIKPANILIKKTIEGPVAKITDFGISKVTDSVNNHTSSALIVSIPYMAPEQLNIKKYGINESISFNLDLWSLGVTIYEVITGNVLFKNSEQDSSEQIMANIMAPELPEKIKVLPQPFRNIVAHCIVKNANERAQKAEELLVLLNSTLTDELPVPVVENIITSPIPDPPANTIAEPATVMIEAEPEPEIKKSQTEPEPIPEKPVQPVQPEAKRKIFIAEPAPEVEKRARKRINILKFSIAGAIVLLILACVFYFSLSKDEKTDAVISQNNDSINNHQDTSRTVIQDSTANKNLNDSGFVKVDSKSQPASTIPKVVKPVESETKDSKPIVKKTTSSAKMDVSILSPCEGTLNTTGYSTKLNAGKTNIRLQEGNYTFELTCDNGSRKSKTVTISLSKRSKNGFQVVTL